MLLTVVSVIKSRGVLKKRFCGNMQQFYRRTPMPKGDFNMQFY